MLMVAKYMVHHNVKPDAFFMKRYRVLMETVLRGDDPRVRQIHTLLKVSTW